MSRHVALLRAVNVGGSGILPMARLRQLAADAGFAAPRTLLQSGNLVFDGGSAPAAGLEARLEQALAAGAGLATDVIVRDAAQWRQLMADNPLAAAAEAAPGAFLVMALKSPPPADALAALRRLCVDGERIEARALALYACFPGGMGRSKLAAAMAAGRGGLRGTGRNWNTVRKLAAALDG